MTPMRVDRERTRRGTPPAAFCLLLLLALQHFQPAAASADSEGLLWEALKSGGHAALMRHADAPGFGDPPGFRLDDCSTQRNLSDAGRRQARAVGARFRERGIQGVPVYSSQWCRCLETARLLGLGEVTPHPGLNSFFQDAGREEPRTAEAKTLIRRLRGGSSAVLVTHQVNITALTGVYPLEGEIVVVRMEGEDLVVVGRIR